MNGSHPAAAGLVVYSGNIVDRSDGASLNRSSINGRFTNSAPWAHDRKQKYVHASLKNPRRTMRSQGWCAEVTQIDAAALKFELT